jgi:hypothetical protein
MRPSAQDVLREGDPLGAGTAELALVVVLLPGLGLGERYRWPSLGARSAAEPGQDPVGEPFELATLVAQRPQVDAAATRLRVAAE